MRRLRGQIPVLVLALALGFAAAASGQTVSTTTGAINGKITDTSGAIMPGVTVSISSPSMQGTRTDVTGVDGIYRFSAIPPGEYRVTYELGGFETQIREAETALSARAAGALGRGGADCKALTSGKSGDCVKPVT